MAVDLFAVTLTGAVATLSVLALIQRAISKKLPPGPRPLPLIGNALNLTTKELWLRATEWGKRYGEIVHISAAGIPMIFLNDFKTFNDLLHNRGDIYSDKPRMVMTGELCGAERMVPFTGAGDSMRRQRRIMVKAIGPGSIKTYEPILDEQSRDFVQNLTKPAMDFNQILLQYNAGVTLMVLYGYKATSADDWFMKLAADSTEVLSNKLVTGGGVWAVDIFPFLRYLPSWFPGAGFKRSAVEWKKLIEAFVNEPHEDCIQKIKNGTATPSFTSLAFDKNENMTEQEDFDLRWTTNSMYTASIDTTGSAIANFILAMIRHPDVLAKARAEVDSVVGQSRLPNFCDRPSMPYIDAMVSECLRYAAPAPLNLPHRLMEDDEYNGYFLPKGSWVVGNIWAISRDETAYPDPNSFKPERFLEPANAETKRRMDPRNYVFGAGRRKCPGVHLVDAGLWLVIARIVATLEIKKKVVDGVEVEPEVSYDNAFMRIPNAFEFDVKPRPHVNWDLM